MNKDLSSEFCVFVPRHMGGGKIIWPTDIFSSRKKRLWMVSSKSDLHPFYRFGPSYPRRAAKFVPSGHSHRSIVTACVSRLILEVPSPCGFDA